MKTPVTSCGPLYLAGLLHYTEGRADRNRLYAAGFVNGQAEKVYLGAARAAMFRPSPDFHAELLAIVQETAERYDLCVTTLRDEIWLCRNNAARREVESLATDVEPNSPTYHAIRGRLCGVPREEIDVRFHARQGAQEPCDKPPAAS